MLPVMPSFCLFLSWSFRVGLHFS
uniref:Uncharacterized protein n=1 Tax=Anguilla anguilla TaxID=7936 RepID=A0A0E9PUH2_ANGAN